MKRALFLVVIFPLLSPAAGVGAQSVPAFDPADPAASFVSLAEYLAADGGRWRAPNPNRDPSRANSPTSFGLWFDWFPRQRRLELRIVTHRGDSTRVSSSGQFAWHPGERRVRYGMSGANGSLTEGTTEFADASTFVTEATFYRPNGSSSMHRDDNVIVDESTHRNETFERDADGDWQSRGVYTWRRARVAPGPLEIVGESFVAVRVGAVDEAAAWYRAALGLEEVHRIDAEERYRIRILARPGLTVELIEQAGTMTQTPDRVVGIFKAGFFVEDIDAAMDHLRARDVDMDASIVVDRHLEARTFVFRDLDGNRLQVFERCGGVCP